jgi:hypothetical protein
MAAFDLNVRLEEYVDDGLDLHNGKTSLLLCFVFPCLLCFAFPCLAHGDASLLFLIC